MNIAANSTMANMRIVNFLLLIFVCLLASFASAQERKDTRIIVHVNDTANLFNRVAMAFLDAGYGIANKDRELGYIQTEGRAYQKYSCTARMRAVVREGVITFTAEMRMDVKILSLEPTFDPVWYTPGKTLMRPAWDEMHSIAAKFGPLTFSK